MAVCRNIETTSQTGLEFMQEVSDTLSAFTNYLGGTSVSVTGTDALTITIEYLDCLTALPNGFELSFIAPADNSGPMSVTLKATDTTLTLGPFNLYDKTGTALNAGAIKAGTLYKIVFREADSAWWIEGEVAAAAEVGDLSNIVLRNTAEFYTPGTGSWTAPFHCIVNITAIGGGGAASQTAPINGGGAGGTCRKTVELLSGQTLNFNIGALGSGDGVPGGDTTVTGPNSLSMAAGGGQGGLTNGPAAAGGNSSGGDYNFTGGSAGVGVGSLPGRGGTVGLIANGLATVGAVQNFAHTNAMPFPFTCDRSVFIGVSGAVGMGGGGFLPGNGAIIIAYSKDLDA